MSSLLVYLDGGGGGGELLRGAIFISSLESVSRGLSPSLTSPFMYGDDSSKVFFVACIEVSSGGSFLKAASPLYT